MSKCFIMASAEEKSETTIKTDNSMPPTFPLARFCYLGYYKAYYPYGNTPAEDFLESCIDEREPSILALGCGDLRSCFYTLWKNFDFSISGAPKRFDGVHFTLNDYSAAVLARNIVFLYLCLQLPEDTMERKKWLSAMWAIWYCHELYPDHLKVLDKSLQILIQFSESLDQWSSQNNPLQHLVQFTSSTCLADIAKVWKMWFDRKVSVSSVKHMHKSRSKVQQKMVNDASDHSFNFTKDNVMIYGEEEHTTLNKIYVRSPEVNSYLASGNCFAEHVFHLTLPKKMHSSVNLTMYERQDGVYTCHYGLIPYISYYHTVEFSSQNMKFNNPPQCDVFISPTGFKTKPFLANSVQQFSMWIQSASRVLKDKTITVLFFINCQDAISFCQQMQQKRQSPICLAEVEKETNCYDVLDTSNLMDHVGPPNLVLASIPLLKPNGLLFTTTMSCRYCTNTREEFLNLCFGLDCQLFPVILGLRCINLDGMDCASSVIIKPTLPDLSHSWNHLPHNRSFIWEKVSGAQPLTFPRLPHIEDGGITEALINAVGSSTYALLNNGPSMESKSVVCHNGIESALLILQQFISHSDYPAYDYSYWEPLCAALKCIAYPFLHCLQTQMQLHNIHAHLTATEDECPLCKKIPLENALGFFCATVPPELLEFGTPFFYAFIHRCSFLDSGSLQREAQEGRDVHIFDCFDATISANTLLLKFFAPLFFVQKEYMVTVILVCGVSNIPTTVLTTSLKDLKIPWTKYTFFQPDWIPTGNPTQNNMFGVVSYHTCDGYKSETAISLSKATLEALSTNTLSQDRLSSREIKLSCCSLNFQLTLSYPVDYETVRVQFPTKGTMCISCKRQPHRFYEEKSCFIVSPDHQLSIPPTKVNMHVMTEQSNMQMTREESQALQTSIPSQHTPMAKVKLTLQLLFKSATSFSFFHLLSPGRCNLHCLIAVNRVLFDYKHRTPAIDLVFCFLDHLDDSDAVIKSWEKVIHPAKEKKISVDDAEFQLLKKSFLYFARRTNGSIQSAGNDSRYFVFHPLKLDHIFSRAVVYFLLCDPDIKLYGSGNHSKFMEKPRKSLPEVGGTECAYCDKLSFTTKKCGRCKKVSYCSKKCQTRHWLSHKSQCTSLSESKLPSTTSTASSFSLLSANPLLQTISKGLSQCTCCKKTSKKCITCTCKTALYCSKDCQTKHWPKHQDTCTDTTKVQLKNQGSDSSNQQVSKCTYCSSTSAKLQKCTVCRTVQYCNIDCQRKHWPEHQKTCKNSEKLELDDKKSLTQLRCSFCNQEPACLIKCKRCGVALYCSEDCQTKHLPEHKKICRKTVNIQCNDLNPVSNYAAHDQLSKCTSCTKTLHSPKKCARCGTVQYCNQNCQKKHWPEHKKTCVNTTKINPVNPELISKLESPDHSLECTFCEKISYYLKKCTRCEAVQYCNKDCQMKHWAEHKKICTNTTKVPDLHVQSVSRFTSDDNSTTCAFCEKTSYNLKKCTRCEAVQYCNRDCQTKHWAEHKKICTDPTKVQPDYPQSVFKLTSDYSPKCAFCKKTSYNLKGCTQCGAVQYCNQDCQKKHWPKHKTICIPKVQPGDLELVPNLVSQDHSPECAYCKKTSYNSLKVCTKCRVVQYCDQHCQKKHWPEHKKICSDAEEISKPPQRSSTCDFCGSTARKLLACGRCGEVKYCSKDCQTRDWKEHRIVCA